MGVSHTIIVSSEELRELIPQKHPMVMIDGLLVSEETMTKTCLTIREDNIFFNDGFFREPGLIENMAQTAASGVGYQNSLSNQAPPRGYIASVQNLNIYQLPEVNSEIVTTITLKHKVFDITVLEGKIHLEKVLIASCDIKVFQKIEHD